MILDKHAIFSEDQLVTVSAESTGVYDLGADDSYIQDLNEKGLMELLVQVTTTFASATSMSVTLQSDDDEAFGSPTTLLVTDTVLEASLVQGYRFRFGSLPPISERYLRLYYTVDGTHSAGAVSAALVLQSQTNGI